MILTNATKLLISKFHVLCILLVAQLASSTTDISRNEDTQEPTERQLDLVTKPYFNLRLFWDRSYRWQESSRETFWCMACTPSTCEPGSKVDLEWCDRNDDSQQWYFDNYKIRSRKNKQMCLQRFGRSIKLQSCTRSKYQKWNELRKDMPFELQIPGNTDSCASQHHHPKAKEEIYMETCKLAEKADTSKWVVYWKHVRSIRTRKSTVTFQVKFTLGWVALEC